MPISALPATRAAIAYSEPAAAASVAWHLANGTIDAAEVEQYGESIMSTTAYTGTAITNGNFSVCWTMTIADVGGNTELFESDSASFTNRVRVRQQADETVIVVNNGGSSAGPALTVGLTYRFILVYDDSAGPTLYVNGASYAAPASSLTGQLNANGQWLAGYSGGFGKYAAYNIALDATQISNLDATMAA